MLRAWASRTSSGAPTGRSSEIDRVPGPLGDGVEIAGPRTGREVLPAAVGDHDHHDARTDGRGAPGRPGHDSARRDAPEQPDVGQPTGPLDRLTGPHHGLAIQEVGAVVVEEDRRDVAVVEVAQAVDHLARWRLDGPD